MRRRTVREEGLEIVIPTMDWEQIGGDNDPGAYGGTIARSDGLTIELIEIQPVRDSVGDDEAAEVGFPFWTREATYNEEDLDPSSKDVQSAMRSVGLEQETLDGMSPTHRALAIADALLSYGVGVNEGQSGWSEDIIHEPVKWSSGEVAGAEYLADEDEAFRDDVLGWGDIKRALEEATEKGADASGAESWSNVNDQMADDLEADGFDPKSIVILAEFGDATAINGNLSDKTVAGLEGELEGEGYEYISNAGGRVTSSEEHVSAEGLIDRVEQDTDFDRENIEAAAKTLDWWQEEIPWGTSGRTYVWAKKKTGIEERRRPLRRR